MAIVEIPVRSDIAAYQLQCTLNGTVYTLHLRFNTRQDRWILGIRDIDNNSLVDGIPLLNGVFLTYRFKSSLLPRGDFLVYDETGQDRTPSREGLGIDFKLLYEEVE
jgi:hypothetical protein